VKATPGILNGQKALDRKTRRGATFRSSGARDVADNQVKGFIVENKTTPGFSVEKIEHKIALKVVQNGQITLKDVCACRKRTACQGGNSFRDTARVLRMTRYMVGWASTGIQMGAFEATLKYTQERLQFGKPIASFQMVAGPSRQDARQRDRVPIA